MSRLSDALPPDQVFLEVMHDVFRLFLTEETGRSLLVSLGVHIASCVIDTNILVQEISKTVKSHEITALIRAVRIGTLRLYAATTVREEVPRKIYELVAEGKLKLDPEQGCQVWESIFVPLIHFLDPSGLLRPSKKIIDLTLRDPTDVPTAQLIELLRPSIVLSEDNDLKAFDPFPEPWTKITCAYRDQGERDVMLVSISLGGGIVVSLSFEFLQLVVMTIAKMDKRLLLVIGVALGAALGAAIAFPQGRRLLHNLAQSLASLAQNEHLLAITSTVIAVDNKAQEAKQFLLQHEREIAQPTRARDYILLVLSRSEGTLRVEEVTKRMIDFGYQPRGEHPERYVRRLLGTYPQLFERTETRQWRVTSTLAS